MFKSYTLAQSFDPNMIRSNHVIFELISILVLYLVVVPNGGVPNGHTPVERCISGSTTNPFLRVQNRVSLTLTRILLLCTLIAKSIFLIPDSGRLGCGLPFFSEIIDLIRYIANRD